jgi:hypothetical protein
MTLSVRNLQWIRQAKPTDDGYSARLYECLSDIVGGTNTLESQTNSNLTGIPAPPPPLQSVTATPTEVGHHISINHGADFYRGAYYHVEAADNPHFTNPFPVYSGPAREIDLATGSQKLYFQAFASYQNSNNTSVVFHGGTTPQAVTGGSFSPRGISQGSGTGRPGEGRSGFGTVSFRGSKPPQRGPA